MTRPDDMPGLLKSRFDYNPDTGKFFWVSRRHDQFPSVRIAKNWNTRFAGKEAFGRISKDGYTRAELFIEGRRVSFLGHVAAFAISYGRMPTKEIDHINRVRSDNRLANLREASRFQNASNVRIAGQYLAGAHPYGRKWEARICASGKPRQIGVFETEAEAHSAYVAESLALHGEFSPFASAIRNRS